MSKTNETTAPGWRECADPVELAAAVAAGVEVRWGGVMDVTDCRTADEFGSNVRLGTTYFVPSSWSPEPPTPDDLVARARRHAARHPESRDLIEELLGWCEDLRASEEKIASERDEAQEWADLLAQRIAPTSVIGEHTSANNPWQRALDYAPAPSPVPPWPGAVLSGLCDEDGVPTWLAQAGQVRGERVRLRHRDDEWATWATLDGDQWVEVRAPRAAAEPRTERVPWYRAMGRTLPYGELLGDIVQAYPSADSPGGIYVEYELPERNTTGNPHRDDADGTVEVLKDGES